MSWAGEPIGGSGLVLSTDTGPKMIEIGPEGYTLVVINGLPAFAVASGTIDSPGGPAATTTIAMNLIWMGY